METENSSITYSSDGKINLPNIKKLFIPDEGYEIADADLSGADIQVVAADSNCKWLLDYFSKPQAKKVYAQVASEYLQRDISDKSDEYKLYKGVFHGSNYLMGVDKLAKMSGLTLEQAKGLQDFYFRLNPEIRLWHKRIEHDVRTKGYVQNKFGRRMEFWITRNNPTVMNEVAAAIPQSTIGDLINRAWVNVVRNLPNLQVLMQTHDSLTMQYPQSEAEYHRKRILELMLIPVPYKIPLYIESDIKVSSISYGDTKKVK